MIPIPLFAMAIGLLTGFTFIFPILGLITLPTALMVIYSILTGDISFIDEKQISLDVSKPTEEE